MKCFTILFILNLIATISINAQGVIFENLKWEEALEKAKAEDKLIFVDAYTEWCGPCKELDKTTFPDNDLGSFHNQNFINIKINVEKGEGWNFDENYQVAALPTLLYIDGDGRVVHKCEGTRSAVDLLLIGKEAINPRANLKYFEDNFGARKHDPDYLKAFIILLKNLEIDGGVEILDEYLKTQSSWDNEETIQLIFEYVGIDLDYKKFKYMIKHKDLFYKYVGEDKIDERIKYAIQVKYGIYDKDELVAEKFLEYFPVKGQQYLDEWKLEDLLQKTNGIPSIKYLDFAISYFDEYEIYEWDELNDLAWSIYEVSSDKTKLIKAKEMAQRSVDLNSNFYNNNTLAAIHYKLGDATEARIYALQAIAEADKMGLDASNTKQLLRLIENIR